MAESPSLLEEVAGSPLLLEEVKAHIKKSVGPFNILIVGRVGVGKSTLINSSNMAVAQTWNELAPFGGGGGNNTTHLTPYTMFEPEYMATPIDGYQNTIKIWDMPGMENLAEDTYIKLIGLVLEGRVSENTSLMSILKDKSMTPAKLDKRFPKIDEMRRIRRVIMVCEANRDIPINLVDTVRSAAKTDGRRIPIFLVFSKRDKVTKEFETACKERRDEALSAFQMKGNLGRFFETGLYTDDNTSCSRETDTKFKRNDKIDNTLLKMWQVLLNPAYDKAILYENKEYVPRLFWDSICNIS